jgi:uncharacterized protein
MSNLLTQKSWSPYLVGAGIGVLSWFAFWSADHPIGVSTAFEHTVAIAEQAAVPQVAMKNPYFADKAREGKPPKIGWEWMLVVGVFLGALVSARMSGDTTREKVPGLWASRFGSKVAPRFLAALLGGAVMMFGARLAGGCTSGHGISGALQLALSSWIFFPTFFLTGTVTALLLYGRKGASHV